jgi:copper chaperone CopZ
MGVCGGEMKTLNIEVEGMNCGRCVSKITDHFCINERIESVEVRLEAQTVKLVGDEALSNMSIRNELIELGFTVNSIKKI